MLNMMKSVLLQLVIVLALGSLVGSVNNFLRDEHSLGWSGPSLAPPEEGTCAAAGPHEISQEEARRLVEREDVIFIDARTEEEYKIGHIPGAIHFPYEDGDPIAPSLMKRLKGCKTVIAYCDLGDCDRSIRLGERLLAEGLAQARVLAGGWPEWYALGYPIEGETPDDLASESAGSSEPLMSLPREERGAAEPEETQGVQGAQ